MKRIIYLMLIFYFCLENVTCINALGDNGGETPSGIPYSELEEVMDNYIKEYIGKEVAGASVAVLKYDTYLFQGYYGYANIDSGKIVDKDAIFEWGSTSKLLVWVSVMQLVEKGQLDLNEDIRNYLPKGFLKKLKYEEPITMLNLMNHNAGWEEHLTDIFYSDPEKIGSLEETLKIFEPNQVFKPGEHVSYSNYGCALAAYVVEQISKVSFYQYVNDNIFQVLRMNHTSFDPVQKNEFIENNRKFTKGYVLRNKEMIERPSYYIGLYPAGGAVGTFSDMCKFVSALIPKEGMKCPLFEDAETLDKLFSKSYEPAEDFPGICHGFWEHYYSVRVLEHGGNSDSFSAEIAIAPESGLAYVVMTNQAHERALCYGLKDMLFGNFKAEVQNGLTNSDLVAGSYRSLRRPFSGFTMWLNFIVTEVSIIDENTINIDGDIYRQIKPYVYQYTDDGGASEWVCFNIENGEVKSMYMEYGEYEPVNSLSIMATMLAYIMFIIISIYFAITTVIMVILTLFKK